IPAQEEAEETIVEETYGILAPSTFELTPSSVMTSNPPGEVLAQELPASLIIPAAPALGITSIPVIAELPFVPSVAPATSSFSAELVNKALNPPIAGAEVPASVSLRLLLLQDLWELQLLSFQALHLPLLLGL
ncbi:unnamed protein product, partial [Ilex paraguariensis]